jgi:peptide/nickel transport system permease protein
MRRLLVRRLLLLVPTMLGAATIVFALLRAVPGDPVEIMLGESASPADAAALRRDLGLDGPPAAQYVGFVSRLLRGDLGRSITYREPVTSVILSRYGATLQLAGAAALVAVALALPLGLLAAARPRSSLDRLARLVSLLGVCVPSFWLGPLLILVFSIQLGWLPVSGRGGLDTVVLPALTLGLGMAGILTRLTRTTMLAALREDWVRTARARGAPEWRVFAVHALRCALPPVVTVAGLQAGGLLAGAIITETIFAWPGLGRLAVEAAITRDYPVIMGATLVVSALVVVSNLVTDLLYVVIDPRISLR